MDSKEPFVTEEPAVGWLRFEVVGEKPFFKSPVPRTVIRNAARLKAYLEVEHSHNRMLDVSEDLFSFKRRHGLRARKVSLVELSKDDCSEQPSEYSEGSSLVDRLTKTGRAIDHKKLLLNSCKDLDELRIFDDFVTPSNFDSLKRKLADSQDLKEMLKSLNDDKTVSEDLRLMFSDACLAEICRCTSVRSPLVEFPYSVNENVYCRLI